MFSLNIHREPSRSGRTSVVRKPSPAVPLKTQRPSMRILLLTDSFLPHAGGSREYYYNIYRELAARKDVEITVVTKKVPGWKAFDKESALPSLRIFRQFRPLKSWKLWELPKAIFPLFHAIWRTMRDSPTTIHVGDLYPQGVIAVFLKKVARIPFVIYCHGEEITQTDRFRYQPRIRNRIYKSAAKIVANSEFTVRQLLRIGIPANHIVKITPGVDAERFSPAAPAPELIDRYQLAGKLVVLTVGRLVPRKGHQGSLQAFTSVCKEFDNVQYVIAGAGPEEDSLRRFANELGIEQKVTFTGLVKAEDLPRLYDVCDIMLLANRQELNGDVEGFGIVFLEASAAGKPVIGCDSGGATEAISDGLTGFIAKPDDVEQLASLLRMLISDRELRERAGAAGRSRAIADFSWKERAHKLYGVNLLLESKRQFTESLPSDVPDNYAIGRESKGFNESLPATEHPDRVVRR